MILIICLVIIISHDHLVSLHEKNQVDHHLTASQWLCKYIWKTSVRSLGPLSLFQVICWNTVCLYMLSCQSMSSQILLSVSNSSKYDKFIYTRYLHRVLWTHTHISFGHSYSLCIANRSILLNKLNQWYKNTTNGYYDWLKCYLNNPKHFFLVVGEVKATSKK